MIFWDNIKFGVSIMNFLMQLLTYSDNGAHHVIQDRQSNYSNRIGNDTTMVSEKNIAVNSTQRPTIITGPEKSKATPDTGPAIVYDIDFEDPWEYKLKPHGKPLVQEVHSNHILPEVSKRMSKSSDAIVLDEEMKQVLRNPEKHVGDSVRSKVSCTTCKIGINLLQFEVHKRTPLDQLKEKFVNICVGFKIEIESVCTGIFEVFAPDLLPAMNMTKIGAPEICSLVLGETCGDIPNPSHEWSIELPANKKPPLKTVDIPKNGVSVFKVLQISDTHFDPDYEPNTPANCQEPLCCRSYSTEPLEEEIEVSGKWGSYPKCDTPRIFLEKMLQSIAEDHKDLDYIIWTGDLPPHDIWNQTKRDNLENIKYTVKLMFETFPNIPIFPALGNHESAPAGSFPPPWVPLEERSIKWLYDEIQAEWQKWLPEEVISSVVHGGFYSVLLRPGFRIVSINTNYCHSYGWWLFVNSTDPASELRWLIYQLQEAEDNAEKVHIIGHIPPGQSDCFKVWSRNFYTIINRYESTVTAQFYGHTHQDEFEVFYDEENPKRPTNIAFIGPSVTTFENNNPGYRIYYVDGDHNETTREVIDHETYYFDLEKANEEAKAGENTPEGLEWKRLYSARSAYGLQSLRPQEWSDLIDKMVVDEPLFDLFYKYYYRDSPTRPKCDDSQCKLQILCDLKSAKSQERHNQCAELEDLLRF